MNKTLQKTLVYSIITLIYATLFTPLIVNTSLFFPYISGKAFTFRLLVEVATLLYIVLAVFDRSFLPKKGFIFGSIFIFTAVLGLATLQAEDPSKSFWSNYERMEGYVTILHLLCFFIITTSVFRTKRAWRFLLNTTLGISVVLGLKAFTDYNPNQNGPLIIESLRGIKYFFQSIFGALPSTVRIAGPLGNSSYLGVYSLIHVFIAGILLVSSNKIKSSGNTIYVRSIYILLALFNIIVLYNTGTRGSFVGLVAGLFVAALIPLCFIIFGKGRLKNSLQESTVRKIKKVSIAFIVVILLSVSTLGFYKDSDFVKKSDLLSRFSSLVTLDVKNVFETQGKSRTLLWGMAWKGVEERPLLGWGQDNFSYVFAKYYDPAMYAQEQWFDRTHNVFFDWLIAGGLLGLLSYLLLFVALLYVLWRKTKFSDVILSDILEKSAVTGLLVAYFVHNLFIFDNLASYILFFTLLAYVHQQSSSTQIDISKHSGNSKIAPLKKAFGNMAHKIIPGERTFLDNQTFCIAVVLLAVLAFGYVSNHVVYKPYMAGKTLIQAMLLTQPNAATVLGAEATSANKILSLFEQAIDYKTFGTPEIREQLAQSVPTILQSTKDATSSKAFTELAAREYASAIEEAPNDPRPYVFFSIYLQKFGLYKESLPYIQKAIELSPTKQSFYFQKGITEVSMKNFAGAVQTFKKAYDLDRTSVESKALYGVSLVYNNQTAEALKELGDDIAALTENRFINALLQKNNLEAIEMIAKKKISLEPLNPQNYMSLAGLYLKENRGPEAIAAIRKVIELNPDFKATGEKYIKDILAGRDPSVQSKAQ